MKHNSASMRCSQTTAAAAAPQLYLLEPHTSSNKTAIAPHTLYLKLSVAGGVDEEVYVKPPPVLDSCRAQIRQEHIKHSRKSLATEILRDTASPQERSSHKTAAHVHCAKGPERLLAGEPERRAV